jgi:hypothetical protein
MVLPYLKGLIIIKCGFFYISLWIYCVFSICGDYICRSIQVLNKWYQSTFLGRHSVDKYFLFLQIFFFGEEKRGPQHSRYFRYIFVQNLAKKITYLSSSHNFTQFQKTNQPKQSPGSEVMSILNSTVFQGFSGKNAAIFCSNLLFFL